jgi:hypothetical protein
LLDILVFNSKNSYTLSHFGNYAYVEKEEVMARIKLIEQEFTVKLIGRPFFFKKLPADPIFTKLYFDQDSFYLTLYFIINGDTLKEYVFNVYNNRRDSRNNDRFIGHFKSSNNLDWYLYFREAAESL